MGRLRNQIEANLFDKEESQLERLQNNRELHMIEQSTIDFLIKVKDYLGNDEDESLRYELHDDIDDYILTLECYRDELERNKRDAFGKAKYKRIT